MALVQAAPETVLRKTKMCRFYGQGLCTKGASCAFAHSRADLEQRPDLLKTQLCLAFQRNGVCRDGSACKYAHGEAELRNNAALKQPVSLSAALVDAVSPAPKVSLSAALAESFGPTPESTLDFLEPAEDSFTRQTSPSIQAVDEFLKLNKWGDKAIAAETDPNVLASTGYQSTSSLISETTSADGDSVKDDSSSKDGLSSKDNDKPQSEPNVALHKTKMCKFFAQGLCRRGAACGFAHDHGALRQQPDLYRTQLCLAFARSGICKDGDSCKFAHGLAQLRGPAGKTSATSEAGGAKQEKPSWDEVSYVGDSDDSSSLKLKLLKCAQEPVYVKFESGHVTLHQGALKI